MPENPCVVIGGSEEDKIPALVTEFSIKSRCLVDVEVIQTYNKDRPMFERNPNPTLFSLVRWWVPELRNFKGRAIYLDSDMVILDDICKIFNLPMNTCAVLRTPDPSVMLIDCEHEGIKHWDAWKIRDAIDAGFQTVMPEYDGLDYDEQVGRVRGLVAYAHARDAAVEAQVGTLAGMGSEHGVSTDPQQARAFVEATGIDLFSAAIGNVHCLRSGTAAVDLALLRQIGEAVDRPLVIHGGSGFPAAAIPEAIDCGVAKFNIGTALKVAYRDAIQQALDSAGDRVDIHDLFGRGAATDAMTTGRIAVKERVLDFMKLYNCTGKA